MPESCDCDHTSIHDCVCTYCRVRYLESRVAELAEGLHLALDRLKWVSRDSESLGFIRSCQPVIRKIEELLKH